MKKLGKKNNFINTTAHKKYRKYIKRRKSKNKTFEVVFFRKFYFGINVSHRSVFLIKKNPSKNLFSLNLNTFRILLMWYHEAIKS